MTDDRGSGISAAELPKGATVAVSKAGKKSVSSYDQTRGRQAYLIIKSVD